MTETSQSREAATLVEIQYRSPTTPWGIARFRRDDGSTFTATGEFGLTVLYEDFIMYGKRVPDIEGGDFEVTQFTSRPPRSIKAIAAYLTALTGASRGATAILVEHFGDATIDILERSPERLAEAGIPERDLEKLQLGWKTLRSDRLALSKVEVEGIPLHKLSKLQRFYGNETDLNQLIKSDPYCLYVHFDDLPFASAMRLANQLGVTNQTEPAIRAAVVAALRREAWLGHSVIEGRHLGETVMRLLRISADVVRPQLASAVSALRKMDVIHVEDSRVQLKSLHDAEHRLFSLIEEWSRRDEADLEADLVPSEEMGFKLLKPLKLKQGETKQLLTGLCGLLSECFAIVQCQTFEDQLLVSSALAHIFNAYTANAVVTTYTLEMLAEASLSLQGLVPAMSYAELIGVDSETGVPAQRSSNPVVADAIVVVGADALGIEEMSHLIEAVPKSARLYLLGCPKDLPSLSVGQPFADLIEAGHFKAFHASFWGMRACAKREVQEAIWAGQLTPEMSGFDPTQPISWIHCDPKYLPSLVPEVIKQVAGALSLDPLADLRLVSTNTQHELVRMVHDAILAEFSTPGAGVTFQGRLFHPGMPVVVRQPLAATDCPAFAVYRPTEIQGSELTLVGINKSEARVTPEDRLDVFDALIMSPKFIRGRRYEFVVLLAIADEMDAINQELISGLLNSSARSLIVIGEVERLAEGISDRPSRRVRSKLLNWVTEP